MGIDRRTRARAYADKIRAEVAELEAAGMLLAGNACSPVLLVKGEPGPAERDGGALLGGPDGKALKAALIALGYEPQDWAAMATWRDDGSPAEPGLARRAIAALDPSTVVACDDAATEVLREAYVDELCAKADVADAMLLPGRVVAVAGMRVLSLGGFEAALSDGRQKQVMWARLKLVPPLGEPY